MPISAQDVMTQAAGVFLGEPEQSYWTNEILLPHLKYANNELGDLLTNNGISVQKNESVTVDIDIGDTEISAYPTDFFLPIELRERSRDSDQYWYRVRERPWIDPDNDTSSSISQWAFRDNKIIFNPPTSQREVFIRYLRNIIAIVDESTNIDIERSMNFLASRTAELASRFNGRNPTKADEIKHNEVGPAEHRLINSFVRNSQKVRRRPYKGRGGR